MARSHLDHHFHVVGGAVTARPPVQVHGRGRGDEVVGLARLELQRRGVGAEAPKRDGKVAEALRLVAHGHNLGTRVRHPTAEVLVLGHAVDDVLLPGVGADDVKLVVLRGHTALVHLQHVVSVIQPEDWVGTVPVHKVCVGRSPALVHQNKQQQAQVHVHGVCYLSIMSFFVCVHGLVVGYRLKEVRWVPVIYESPWRAGTVQRLVGMPRCLCTQRWARPARPVGSSRGQAGFSGYIISLMVMIIIMLKFCRF